MTIKQIKEILKNHESMLEQIEDRMTILADKTPSGHAYIEELGFADAKVKTPVNKDRTPQIVEKYKGLSPTEQAEAKELYQRKIDIEVVRYAISKLDHIHSEVLLTRYYPGEVTKLRGKYDKPRLTVEQAAEELDTGTTTIERREKNAIMAICEIINDVG